jgi:hypothetical protein
MGELAVLLIDRGHETILSAEDPTAIRRSVSCCRAGAGLMPPAGTAGCSSASSPSP